MNILLTLTAYILVALFAPIGMCYQVIFRFRTTGKYFFNVAISFDQLGNTVCGEFLNLTLTKGAYYRFGNPDETVSSCLGKNKQMGTLTLAGLGLCALLHKLEKDHVEKSIELDENIT